MNKIPVLGFVLCNGLFRIAVPMFLVISGYYFVNIDTLDKLKKWVIRLGVLYIIWMLFYTPFWTRSIHGLLLNILMGYGHLWYLIGTLFAGVLLYTLRNVDAKLLFGISVFLFLIGFSIQTIGNLHVLDHDRDIVFNDLHLYRNFLFFCFPFLVIGFLLRKGENRMTIKPSLITLVIAGGLLVMESFLTFLINDNLESVDLLLSLLIITPILFLYVKNLKHYGPSKYIADFATGIYLVHLYAISLAEQVNKLPTEYIFGKFGILGVTFIISFLLVKLKKKIPYIL